MQKQQEIIKNQASREDEIPADGSEEIELVQNNLIKSMIEKLVLRDKQTLSQIKNALAKIANGTFGKCDSCEEEINEKRLNALPYCKYCIFCAEKQEKEEKQFRSA